IPINISSTNREKMAAYTAIRLANATGNRRPAGNNARTTTMTRPAENSMEKKSGDEIPATAAATRETKARGSATLANFNKRLIMCLGLALVPSGSNAGCLRELALADYPNRLLEPDQTAIGRDQSSGLAGRVV